jgi:hypothetical protein
MVVTDVVGPVAFPWLASPAMGCSSRPMWSPFSQRGSALVRHGSNRTPPAASVRSRDSGHTKRRCCFACLAHC